MNKDNAGTPFFSSPEMINNNISNYSNDIWALGVTIYQLASLELPFGGKKLEEISRNQRIQPKEIPKIYSSDLVWLIEQMLTYNYKKRPTAASLLNKPSILKQIRTLFKPYDLYYG